MKTNWQLISSVILGAIVVGGRGWTYIQVRADRAMMPEAIQAAYQLGRSEAPQPKPQEPEAPAEISFRMGFSEAVCQLEERGTISQGMADCLRDGVPIVISIKAERENQQANRELGKLLSEDHRNQWLKNAMDQFNARFTYPQRLQLSEDYGIWTPSYVRTLVITYNLASDEVLRLRARTGWNEYQAAKRAQAEDNNRKSLKSGRSVVSLGRLPSVERIPRWKD